MFDIISNISFSFIELFRVEEHDLPIFMIIIFTLFFTFSQSDQKFENLIKAWQIWVLIDYILMALLM